MTVRELIESLNKIEDQNIRVMVKGYERGVEDIENIIPEIVNVALSVNTEWWNGSHEVVSNDHTYTDKEIVRAIVLR
jgi:hypothetical protein